MEARSATSVAERDLLAWALTDRPGASVIAWALELRGAHHAALEVGPPVLVPGPRETAALDALLWPAADPSEAIAIEAKRVRVTGAAFRTGQIGGLAQLAKGAQQANAHARRGFHCAVLLVLIAVDGRTRSGGSWLGGGLRLEMRDAVVRRLDELELDSAVGLLALAAEQPVDRDVRSARGVGVVASRRGDPQPQDPALTRRIARFSLGLAR